MGDRVKQSLRNSDRMHAEREREGGGGGDGKKNSRDHQKGLQYNHIEGLTNKQMHPNKGHTCESPYCHGQRKARSACLHSYRQQEEEEED